MERMFFFPDMMDWSVGYRIPSSHDIPSFLFESSSVLTANPSCKFASSSARSLSKARKYCKCAALTCHLRMVRKMSLLFVHPARFLQNSMWQCSGPCVLKFSVHPNKMISLTCYVTCYLPCYMAQDWTRTLCKMLCAFSKFHPEASPVFSGILDFKSSNSSIDISCSFSQSSATSPKRRC